MSVTENSKFKNPHAKELYFAICDLLMKNYLDTREKIQKYFERFEYQIGLETSKEISKKMHYRNQNIVTWLDAELLEQHYNWTNLMHTILVDLTPESFEKTKSLDYSEYKIPENW
jgi:hypothetical protein